MCFNIWLSNFARLAANEINPGQKGYQNILRERFLSACANNTNVSVRQFTLPSTISETTPKISEKDLQNENERADNETDKNQSDEESDNSDQSGGEESESNQQSEEEEDEDSEAEAVIRKEAYDRLLRSQLKS